MLVSPVFAQSIRRELPARRVYRMTSLPPMYIRSGCGMRTEPSAFRLFSKNAISMAGRRDDRIVEGVGEVVPRLLIFDADAQPARLRVAKVGAAAHLEVFLLAGAPRSTSRLLTLRSARSPEQHSSVRTGMSRERK